MDELRALEQWGKLYSVHISTRRGIWHVSIAENQQGTAYIGRDWRDMQVAGEAEHDPLLAMQSALIQAKAKWPAVWEGLQQHDN